MQVIITRFIGDQQTTDQNLYLTPISVWCYLIPESLYNGSFRVVSSHTRTPIRCQFLYGAVSYQTINKNPYMMSVSVWSSLLHENWWEPYLMPVLVCCCLIPELISDASFSYQFMFDVNHIPVLPLCPQLVCKVLAASGKDASVTNERLAMDNKLDVLVAVTAFK